MFEGFRDTGVEWKFSCKQEYRLSPETSDQLTSFDDPAFLIFVFAPNLLWQNNHNHDTAYLLHQ